jgi:hypothetical protein
MPGAGFSIFVLVALHLGGCSLIVDFDRSLLSDGGVDAGLDAEVEASSETPVDDRVDAASDEAPVGR